MAKRRPISFLKKEENENSTTDLVQYTSDSHEEVLAAEQSGRVSAVDMMQLVDANLDGESKNAKRALCEGAFSYLTLPSTGQRIKFRHAYFGPTQLDLVRVSPNNIRDFASITEADVEHLLPSVRAHGILQEVIAVKRNGYYEIIDGSIRFFIARLLGTGLPIKFTEDDVAARDERELSRLANERVPTSLYEKGLYYRSLGITEIRELSRITGDELNSVSVALRSIDIPMPVFKLFPSQTRIGRPTLKTVLMALGGLTKGQKDDLVLQMEDAGPQESNQQALKVLTKAVAAITEAPSKAKAIQVGSCSINRSSPGRLTITTKDQDLLDRIEKLITDAAAVP